MVTSEYIDLSLIKNQNKLAVMISDFFTKEELESIDLSKIEKSNRDLDEIQFIYYNKQFEGGKSIKIIDTLILDSYPAARYVTVRLEIGEMVQLDYKCKYCKNIINQLNVLFGKVYNYKYWKSEKDDHIVRSHIIYNYSKNMKRDLTEEELEEVKFIIVYLVNDGSIKNDNNFDYDFSIGNFNFNIKSNPVGIVRFSYKNKKDIKWNKIYVNKNDVGIASIELIIQQALNQI